MSEKALAGHSVSHIQRNHSYKAKKPSKRAAGIRSSSFFLRRICIYLCLSISLEKLRKGRAGNFFQPITPLKFWDKWVPKRMCMSLWDSQKLDRNYSLWCPVGYKLPRLLTLHWKTCRVIYCSLIGPPVYEVNSAFFTTSSGCRRVSSGQSVAP